MRAALAAVLLLAAAGVQAAPPAGEVPPARSPLPLLGLVVDAGLPGGAGLLLQARLADALRAQAGPMYAGVGFGLKGGLVLAPLRGAVSPTLEVEGGWAPRADLSFVARRSDVPGELRPVLAHSSYWYVSGLVGLELGSPRGLSFFVRAGIARLEARAPRTASTRTADGTLEIGDATLRTTMPCAKLGLQLWF